MKWIKKHNKFISVILATFIFVISLPFGAYKVYADQVALDKVQFEFNDLSEVLNEETLESISNPKQRNAFLLAPLLPEAATALGMLLKIFGLAMIADIAWESGAIQKFLIMLDNMLLTASQAGTAMRSKLEQLCSTAHSATIGFLVAYQAFDESVGQIQASTRDKLLKFYNEKFIVGVESALAQGVSIATLKMYGVTSFFFPGIFQDILTDVPGSATFPNLYGGTIINEGTAGAAYRYLGYNVKDAGREKYTIAAGKDPDMSIVDKVQITRKPVEKYNYGWDGLCWTQQYYLKQANDGLYYMFVISIAKALSPNQLTDKEHDGISFGLYQVDSSGAIVKGNANNFYYQTGDERLNTFVPAYGTNLYKSSSVNFGNIRKAIIALYGVDMFINIPSSWDTGKSSILYKNRLTDYSKNEPGIYDSSWVYKNPPLLPMPGDNIDVKFPVLKPGQTGVSNPALNPDLSGGTVTPPYENLFPPTAFPMPGDSVNLGDMTTFPDLDDTFGDILNPGTDIPGEGEGEGVITPDLSGIAGALQKIIEFLKSIGSSLANILSAIKAILSSLTTGIGNILSDILSAILSILSAITSSISNTLSNILSAVQSLAQTIVGAIDTFWENALDFIKTLFVPPSDYWTNEFNKLENLLKPKVPTDDIENLKNLASGENAFKDIYVTIFGQRVLICKLSVMNDIIPWARPILQGIIAIFLLIYNFNQVYKLIRGTSFVGSQGTTNTKS